MKKTSLIAVLFFVVPLMIAEEDEYLEKRLDMVESQIVSRGIESEVVLDAMHKVKRHLFVDSALEKYAYQDGPLPIGYDQTISQPYIVAIMTEKLDLNKNSKVLEIGTGSGYQAAILAEIVLEVYTIEILEPLADIAKNRLNELDYNNVFVKCGDGYLGWPEEEPFDAIIVTAAPKEIPERLIKQLKVGGKMVIPVGTFYQEVLL